MRVVDYLILILRTHGRLLSDLSGLMGEDLLIRHLAQVTIPPPVLEKPRLFEIFPLRTRPATEPFPFEQIEESVSGLNLGEGLEHYVWAYPFYRTFIENDIDLNEKLPMDQDTTLHALCEEVLEESRQWIQALPIENDEARSKAHDLSESVWTWFRSQLYRENGQNPLKTVSRQLL